METRYPEFWEGKTPGQLVGSRRPPHDLLSQERELAVCLEHPDADLGEVGDPLLARRVLHVLNGQPFDLYRLDLRLPAYDDEYGCAIEPRPEPRELELEVRQADGEERER